jgi:cyclophilin family peptidyl-prolyl cis-trans isomerase
MAKHQQWKDAPAMTIDAEKRYTATLETNKGAVEVEFFPKDAPNTVNNFICLARAGYFDGTPFHRIVSGFVIQGGDPTGTGTGGPGYRFADEPISRDYDKGTLAMANAGPNTNGSQFFIVLDDLKGKLQKNYTIFGQVIDGQDVVDQIGQTNVGRSPSGEMSAPTESVTLEKVTVHEG